MTHKFRMCGDRRSALDHHMPDRWVVNTGFPSGKGQPLLILHKLMNKSQVEWWGTSRAARSQRGPDPPRRPANRTCIHIRFPHKICCNCNKCFTNGRVVNMIVNAHLKMEIEENFVSWHWRLKWPRKTWINLCWSQTQQQHRRAKKISIQLTLNPHSTENEKWLFKSGPYHVKVYNLNF